MTKKKRGREREREGAQKRGKRRKKDSQMQSFIHAWIVKRDKGTNSTIDHNLDEEPSFAAEAPSCGRNKKRKKENKIMKKERKKKRKTNLMARKKLKSKKRDMMNLSGFFSSVCSRYCFIFPFTYSCSFILVSNDIPPSFSLFFQSSF